MKVVIILDQAIEDIQNGKVFYDEQATGLGDYFAASILNDIASW